MSGRDQSGVIPFRRRRGAIEVCLIRNKDGRKWKIPKGFIDAGESAAEAALKEAWEEAGLEGRIVGAALGSYEHEKWGLELTVTVFLMEVTGEEDEWDESRFRERRWMPLATALDLMDDHPVHEILEAAGAKMERRRKARTGSSS